MLWICSTAVPAKAQLSFVVIGANFTPLPVDLQQQGQYRCHQNPVNRSPVVLLLCFALLMLMVVGHLSRAKRISVSLALSEKTSCDGVATLR